MRWIKQRWGGKLATSEKTTKRQQGIKKTFRERGEDRRERACRTKQERKWDKQEEGYAYNGNVNEEKQSFLHR